MNALRSREESFYSLIVLTSFLGAAKLENVFLFSPSTNTRQLVKASSAPRSTTSSIPCAVPRSTLFPAAVISMGGFIPVYSSIFDSTSRIDSGSMKCFDDPTSTKS